MPIYNNYYNFFKNVFIIFPLYTTLFINNVTTEIAILGKGIDLIEEDDIGIVFYITVKNICKDDLELSVNFLQCCETILSDEIDCNSIMLIGGDMGTLPSMYVTNLTLIYPNLYLLNRRGVCSIEITYRNQLKKNEINVDIHFDTARSCLDKQNNKRCETVDLDIKQNCNPADCLIKYSGMNSYFNPKCKRCQKVPVCNTKTDGYFPDTAYSPYSNECVYLYIPISKRDLEDIENYLPVKEQTTVINAICHYGKVTENGECLCNFGWTTATSDEGMYEPGVAQHHLCNIQVGGWNSVNKSRIQITAIIMTVLAITVISKVVFLMCLMTLCYKYIRKPEKYCAKELDPDDQSIVLCDALNSSEKCLCNVEAEGQNYMQSKEKGSKVLHAQTVNVSYFPCSVSTFSSVKTITASSKSSCKSGQNHTISSAISFPEGTSSEETENTSEISL